MEEKVLFEKISGMKASLTHLYDSLAIAEKRATLAALEVEILAPGFWDDQTKAQEKIARQNGLKDVVHTWEQLNGGVLDAEMLAQMLQEEHNEAEYAALIVEVKRLETAHEAFLLERLFAGEHDGANAYVEIHPGEGGVDAQDFAQMLYRLYLRWAERNGLNAEVLSYQAGDEAGIKSAMLVVKGMNAYGKLKGEAGVHRLVRLSPFDTAKRRHTSFASIHVSPEVAASDAFILQDKDLKIDTYRSSGAGGQSVNTTDSAVRITHLPTGTVVTCQNERSQIQNREQALKILYAKLVEADEQKKRAEQDALAGEKKGIGFGSQIRSYVFHPYNMVKDHRTNYEVGNVRDVMDGNINGFIESYLKYITASESSEK
jgi:peptide chain release factor 2